MRYSVYSRIIVNAEAVTAYLDYLRYEKRMSSNTIIAYQTDLEQFMRYAEQSFQLDDIVKADADMIRTWVMTLMEEGVTTRSVNRKISCLKSFYNYQHKMGVVEDNVMRQVVSPKMSKRLPHFVEEQDMERLFTSDMFEVSFEGIRDRAILELFYSTGMRLSELMNIKQVDIDFYERTVKVLGKRNKERVIPLNHVAVEALEKYLSVYKEQFGEMNKNSCIFVTSKNRKLYPKLIYNIVRKYLDCVTTIDKRSPHVLRHTFATHMLNNGADINAIKEILGHSSLAATQVYTHNTIEKLKSIYQQAHPRA